MAKETAYLVKTRITCGEYESNSIDLVFSLNEKDATRQALALNCHHQPEFESDTVCWDSGESLLTVRNIKTLTETEAAEYARLTRFD